jgi:hypothetical protein
MPRRKYRPPCQPSLFDKGNEVLKNPPEPITESICKSRKGNGRDPSGRKEKIELIRKKLQEEPSLRQGAINERNELIDEIDRMIEHYKHEAGISLGGIDDVEGAGKIIENLADNKFEEAFRSSGKLMGMLAFIRMDGRDRGLCGEVRSLCTLMFHLSEIRNLLESMNYVSAVEQYAKLVPPMDKGGMPKKKNMTDASIYAMEDREFTTHANKFINRLLAS